MSSQLRRLKCPCTDERVARHPHRRSRIRSGTYCEQASRSQRVDAFGPISKEIVRTCFRTPVAGADGSANRPSKAQASRPAEAGPLQRKNHETNSDGTSGEISAESLPRATRTQAEPDAEELSECRETTRKARPEACETSPTRGPPEVPGSWMPRGSKSGGVRETEEAVLRQQPTKGGHLGAGQRRKKVRVKRVDDCNEISERPPIMYLMSS